MDNQTSENDDALVDLEKGEISSPNYNGEMSSLIPFHLM
jgi:hypothetical protein